MNEKESPTIAEKAKALVQKFAGRKLIVLSAAGVIVAAAVLVVIYSSQTKDGNGNRKEQRFGVSGNSAMAEYVTASGTTSLGYTMDEFEPDYIDTEIYIEEVYLSSGDEVTEGTPVFKVSEESIAEAREELEEKKEESALAYRAGLITYQQSKINAKYTYDTAVLEGQQAEAVYNSAVKAAEEKLQLAKDNVTETEQKIEEYGNAYTGYYYDYHVDEYKESYERNNSHYYTFLEEYGFTDSDSGGGFSAVRTVSANGTDENNTRRLQTIQQMKKNMESSKSSYDKAWNEYEAAADQAAAQAEKLKIQIASLRADLTEAETTYQLEIVEAETAYKKSLAQSQLAKSDYDAAIQKAEDELEALEDEKTEAEENLAEFEALLGDGYFYTQNAGTVMMVGTRSESNLQGGSMVVAYRNAEDISVTVSVSQEDINKLKVGDSAQVIVEGYGTFEGQITYLNPISNSDSRTNITYEVMVDLNGDNISSLTENLTATVIFQTGDSVK